MSWKPPHRPWRANLRFSAGSYSRMDGLRFARGLLTFCDGREALTRPSTRSSRDGGDGGSRARHGEVGRAPVQPLIYLHLFRTLNQ